MCISGVKKTSRNSFVYLKVILRRLDPIRGNDCHCHTTAPVMNTLLAGTRPKKQKVIEFRAVCLCSIRLCSFSVLYTSAAVFGVVVCIYFQPESPVDRHGNGLFVLRSCSVVKAMVDSAPARFCSPHKRRHLLGRNVPHVRFCASTGDNNTVLSF